MVLTKPIAPTTTTIIQRGMVSETLYAGTRGMQAPRTITIIQKRVFSYYSSLVPSAGAGCRHDITLREIFFYFFRYLMLIFLFSFRNCLVASYPRPRDSSPYLYELPDFFDDAEFFAESDDFAFAD